MIGQVIRNRYKILQQIGKGGAAWIYLAKDNSTGAQVAVKVLFPQFAEDIAYVQRFTHEAKESLRLSDPHIVKVLDYGVDRDVYYLAMEYIEGRDVKAMLKEDGAFTVEQMLDITGQVVQAIKHANDHGIVHSYIEPQSIMIMSTGMVKLLDLGIAQAHSLPSLTQTGFVGSMYYISPEQAMGGRVDIRSGIYSLGTVMYEMLAGTPPFTASTPWMIVNMHISGQVVPLSQRRPGVPKDVEWLISKAMAKDPQDRFQSPGELGESLVWVVQETQGIDLQKLRGAAARGPQSGTSGQRGADRPTIRSGAVTDEAAARRLHEQVTALYGQGLMHYGAREWSEAKALFEEVARLIPNYQDTETLLNIVNKRLGPNGGKH